MEEEPPKCLLGCCNVRSATLALSIFLVVFLPIDIIADIMIIIYSFDIGYFFLIFDIFYLYVNIKLMIGVEKHDIAAIRRWLWVTLVSIFPDVFKFLNEFTILMTDQNSQKKKQEKNLSSIVIIYIIIKVLSYYLVYQFYIFEKKRLQSIGISHRPQNA